MQVITMHVRKVEHLTISGKIIIIGSAASDRSIHCTTTWSVCHYRFVLLDWTGEIRNRDMISVFNVNCLIDCCRVHEKSATVSNYKT